MSDATFDELGLDPGLLAAVEAQGFATPTPIQTQAIPPLLEGRDVVGGARTGSGKTAAFALPLLQAMAEGEGTQALVMAPTRELALQVSKAISSFAAELPLRVTTVYGGSPYGPQLGALRSGVEVVVGTPGRLLDHLERGSLNLSRLKIVVLDEADEMLRMGFIEDVDTILAATPDSRQVALFSATMPPAIRKVAKRHLNKPVDITVEEEALTVDHIQQRWLLVPQRHKLEALIRLIRADPKPPTLVFARTRAGCAAVADALAQRGLAADALHGDLNQSARERVLSRLRAERLGIVIATDVAARGLDVDHLERVINLDLPESHETYVHRIGRTGRAGRAGLAISLVTPGQRRAFQNLQRALGATLQEMRVPSDADIVAAQRRSLQEGLKESLQADDVEATRGWVTGLLATEEWTAEDLAVAAVRALALADGIDLGRQADDVDVAWARPRDQRPPPRTQNVDEIEIFVPMGRQSGVRPQDLVGAIANDLGVPGRVIGRITIFSNNSFVCIPREIAEDMLSRDPSIELRGNVVNLSRARGAANDRRGRAGERTGGERKPRFKPKKGFQAKKGFHAKPRRSKRGWGPKKG